MAQHQDIAIEIRTNDPLALSIQENLDQVPYQSIAGNGHITIFRVPSHIRVTNKNFFEPRMVSIGPYHRGREDLKCMEKEKLRYVHKMLSENSDRTLVDYLKVLRDLEPAARQCYYENIEMDSDEFVKMLLYDACFIIQLIVNWSFPDNDIITEISWNIPLIKSDLLMLENQIPFFVLQRVFNLYSTRDEEDTTNLTSLSSDNSMISEFDKASTLSEDSEPEKATLIDCLVEFLQHGSETMVPNGDGIYDHLLHFYYDCYMSTQEFPTMLRNKYITPLKIKIFILKEKIKACFENVIMRKRYVVKRKPRMIPCATELQEVGITFKKTKVKSIFSVHFSNGVLMIPYSSVEEARRPHIMNLIAFEQCRGAKNKPLTSYAVFMDCIVKEARDVLILQQNGIMENNLGNEKTTAEFFNQLRFCSYLNYDNHHLAEIFQKVKNYCDSASRWQKHRAKLHRDYFSSPWSIISLFAAIVIVLLTFLQTLYSVMAYHHP